MESKTLKQALKNCKIVSPPYFGGGDKSLIKWIKANLTPREVVMFLHPPKGSTIIEKEGGYVSLYFAEGSKQIFDNISKSEYDSLYRTHAKIKNS